MPTFRTLRVVEILAERPGLQRVGLDDDSRAYALTQLTGSVSVGDAVVVNTTAVDLGLGTGGWHVVHWNLSQREFDEPGPGHIMKLRYTSLQVDTGAAEEFEWSGTMEADQRPLPDLGGVPILIGSLHSQVGIAAAVAHETRPDLRVVYVMTDGAALPLALSDLVHDLRERRLLHGTVTAGHSFGGDLEAVSTASALQLAVERLGADLVICAMGPGVVGTATALGTTAVEVASIATTAVQLGARPVVMVRASEADGRSRHRGISHHTRTALALTPVPVDVVITADLLALSAELAPHRVVVGDGSDSADLLARHAVRVTTMGRGPADDPVFFATTAAAARHAVALVSRPDTVSGA
jgi:hypothetical protein